MKTGVENVYRAVVSRPVSADSYLRGKVQLLTGSPEMVPRSMEVTHSIDGESREKLVYRFDGRKMAMFVSDAKVGLLSVKTKSRQAELRPDHEGNAFPSFGFFLPPDESRLFVRERRPDEKLPFLDPCPAPECTSLVLLNDVNNIRRYVLRDGDRWWCPPEGFRPTSWTVDGGTPTRRIVYREGDAGRLDTDIEWNLIRSRPYTESISWRKEIPKGFVFVVFKGHRGFVSAYNPNVRDPWAGYAEQVAFDRADVRHKTLPYPMIGAGILASAVAVCLVSKWLSGRRA